MKQKTIAIDVDDVLAISADALVRFSNQKWGTNLTVDDYDEDWSTMWKVDEKEAARRSKIWHSSGEFILKKPQEYGLEVLKELSKDFRLIVATSRRKELMEDTKDWLDTHFRGIFSEIHFSGIWDKNDSEAHKVTKAQMCKEIGADFLVDDQLKHCLGAAEAGIPAVLFGEYAWNHSVNLPSKVTRCRDWQAVLEYFSGQR